ncbi:MAG: hypothetical protein A2898_05605 [Candidatus Kerfeldbacteria bacterium RIFCSPLOWO2_01_FULL_48_11]|uniref:Thioredoxin domain-containing protein n=1 Tax=Candidatus Kerfeldbacteria bacterium RIFCSPLOWO2_01_FULL_48_11 TaxID=1798543 RepID=A0A1G2B3R2_9BACT|nr:MAG: DSBA oxidoreductase [Parcubacteria group bacterium GW2011_GWA2_48_9]KKW15544.1 MAG: DSBA oxidoreductase [Parcubacteria group bacterium GW2011_GWC2_49_9]OGY83635.1 MAG: hypothetical protein A2898_05605 [Candidatus Kerfeldbacteria bacterium RIFCSPLOWO2_01_FULL_48_11]HCM67628.1 hypothetical protein [Candidatus Kerfeldbacteria bacterium]
MADQSMSQPQELTKKQRKEMRREERRNEEQNVRRSSIRKKYFGWGGISIGIALLIVWAVLSSGGSNGTNSALAPDNDPFKGIADAQVVLTEYSDFQCPACKSALPIVQQVIDTYADRIKITYNNFPLSSIHQNSDEAAKAGECAFDQNKFWEYHDMLYDRQDLWANMSDPQETFTNYAQEVGMDTGVFNTCYDGSDAKDRVEYDKREGNTRGINSTPTFMVDDEVVRSVRSFADLQEVIDAALGNTNQSVTK